MENSKQLKFKKFLFKKIISLLLVLLGITILCFVLLNLSPIDAADAYIHKHMMPPTKETVQKIQVELGLNKPLYQRYLLWLKGALTLDFGESFVTGKAVAKEIPVCCIRTIKIVLGAVLTMFSLSVLLGILSALRKDKIIDQVVRGITLMGMSIPSYWMGFMLIYLFSIKLKILPFIFKDSFSSYILPSVSLAIPFIATYTRMVRTNILEKSEEDFVMYAQARGIPQYKIMIKHILKSSSVSLIYLLGQNIGNILAGTAVIETVFSIKGLGRYGLDAIFARDNPASNAYVVIIAFCFAVINLLSDIIAMKLDKRFSMIISQWAWYAKFVRGYVIEEKNKGYVKAAIASGTGSLQIILRHIIPNILPAFIVYVSVGMGRVILELSAFSFLGFGVSPDIPEWGAMLNESRKYIFSQPQLMLYPGLFIFITALGFNLLGDGLRDIFDKKKGGIHAAV